MGKWHRTKSLRRRWQRSHLINHYGNNCFYCEKPMDMHDITIDHHIPLSRGGTDDITNYRLAHTWCNHLKADMLPDEFAAFQAGEIEWK